MWRRVGVRSTAGADRLGVNRLLGNGQPIPTPLTHHRVCSHGATILSSRSIVAQFILYIVSVCRQPISGAQWLIVGDHTVSHGASEPQGRWARNEAPERIM